jgi:hypothetical protein
MIAAGEQGALFEATGEVFGRSEDDMGFLQGAAGSLAGQLVGGLLSKIPANKASEIFNKVFGANADKAKKVLQRAAGIAETATGETAEEFGEELASIYQSTLDANGFFAELENRFGTFDKVMKFVVSSYALGAGMGIAMNNKKADELKEAMNPEDKQKVEDALTAVRTDLQEATSAMNIAANTAAEEIKAEKIVSGEAKLDGDSETEKEDAGIQFDVEGIIKNDKEGEQVTEEVTESSFTQPIDLTDDKENKPGVSGEERKGEEPVKEQPIVETGKEEASPSGVVQKEQEVTKSEIEKIQEEIDSYDEEYNNLVDLVNKEERKLNAPKSENEIKLNQLQNKIQKLRDKRDGLKSEPLLSEEKPVSKSKRKRTATKETGTKVVGEQVVEETKAEPAPKAEESTEYSKENPKIIENENDAIELDRITRDSFEEKISGFYLDRKGKNWVVSIPATGDVQFKGSLKKAKEYIKNHNFETGVVGFKEADTEPTTPTKTETTAKAEPSGKTRELPTTAETANQFKEASSISKMPMRSPKRKKAVADFDAKYGEGSYKRVSKIDANFGDIINKLENSNIVTKEC